MTLVRDGIEDYERHKADKEENNQRYKVLKGEEFKRTNSENIRVGNIIKVDLFEKSILNLQIDRDESFPCDMLLIATSDKKGWCYIETKNLDGETNKKIRMVEKKEMFRRTGYQEGKVIYSIRFLYN